MFCLFVWVLFIGSYIGLLLVVLDLCCVDLVWVLVCVYTRCLGCGCLVLVFVTVDFIIVRV